VVSEHPGAATREEPAGRVGDPPPATGWDLLPASGSRISDGYPAAVRPITALIIGVLLLMILGAAFVQFVVRPMP